jgi:hypothetical protein
MEKGGIESTTTAIIPRGRPQSLVGLGVKLACGQTGDKGTITGAYLVGTSREPFSHKHNNLSLDPSDLRGDHDEVGLVIELSSLFNGLVVPRDTEKIQGVDISGAWKN